MNAVTIDFAQFIEVSNSEPVTTSEFVAKAFNKSHKNILQKIDEISTQVPDFFYKLNFQPLDKTVKSNLGNGSYQTRMVELTKDGFMLLVMGFTGVKAMSVKIAYIEAFNSMAESLKLARQQVKENQYQENLEKVRKAASAGYGNEPIGLNEQCVIQKAVKKRQQRTGESTQAIYRKLHAYLRIKSYLEMPIMHYTAAIRFLESTPDTPQLFRQLDLTEEGPTNWKALISYAVEAEAAWNAICPLINSIGGGVAYNMGDIFHPLALCARSVATSLGLERPKPKRDWRECLPTGKYMLVTMTEIPALLHAAR